VVALLLGFALLTGVGLGQAAAGFVFTPGEEYAYKIEIKRQWRDAAEQDLPNWVGEMKVWPIETQADGRMLVRARIAMNPDEPGITRTQDNTVAWTEFSVGPNGADDYVFVPHSEEAPMIRLAFVLPPPLQLNWQALGPDDEVSSFSFAPGWMPNQSPWTILIDDQSRYLKSWHATRRSTCSYDPKAGRVLKMETRTDFPMGMYVWTDTTATFEQEKTLTAGDAALIKHDSAELSGAMAEFEDLWLEANDPVHEPDEFQRRVDASWARIRALGTVIKSPEFGEDARIVSSDNFHTIKVKVAAVYAARQALLDKPSPDWTAQDLAGKAYALKDYRGKIVLLDIWGCSNAAMEKSAPVVNKIAKDYAGQAVAVIGVNRYDGRDAMGKAIEGMQVDYPELVGLPVMRAYKIQGLPRFLLIDQDGVVRFQHAGWDDATDTTLRGEIDQLLAKVLKE
jgi:hypothetical protein